MRQAEAILVAYDIMEVDGQNVCPEPLEERRKRLATFSTGPLAFKAARLHHPLPAGTIFAGDRGPSTPSPPREDKAVDLICYLTDDHPVDIRPARNRRQWMNQTPDSYAYRCLSLSIANAHGWEVRCPVTFEAEWNGGPNKEDVRIIFEDGEDSFLGRKKIKPLVESHFGSGILTLNVGVIIRTPPGYDLWVTGPVNESKDGIQALSAVIETYWMPNIFTMNWKFTRPNSKVTFEKGEPFCFFFPIEHGLLERFNPAFEPINEDPDLERQHNFAFNRRGFLTALKILKGDELKIEEKDHQLKFHGWYMRGEMPDGTEVVGHKNRVQLKPFKMAASKGTTHQ